MSVVVYGKYPNGLGGSGMVHHEDDLPALSIGDLRVYAWEGIIYRVENEHLWPEDQRAQNKIITFPGPPCSTHLQ